MEEPYIYKYDLLKNRTNLKEKAQGVENTY